MTNAITTQWSKVPAVTPSFWLLKFLATTGGELLGDFLSTTLGMGDRFTFLITLAVTAILLVAQVKATRIHSLRYWGGLIATVALSSESSDMLSSRLLSGHRLDTLVFAACLLLVFVIWHRISGPIQYYPIRKRLEELFYWAAVFFASGLGVAFGDFLSDSAGISFLPGALICAGVLALMLAAYYTSRVDRRLLFWITFIFTRPFGA